jgi:ADP-heptose:LPS heptosyltransferase
MPYWIVVAGGKFDFTIKWWHFRRWQAVVDSFRERMLFVQIGESHHYHPALKGVLDLRGETSLRDLIRLVYHAQGVLCPVTLLMHLAAAVETKPGGPQMRPCVVVAGGREPWTWEAYPNHRFLHTIGKLPCCAKGGCWRARSVPLGDGDSKDEPKHLCVDTVNNLPRCMEMISPTQVVDAVESYAKQPIIRQPFAERPTGLSVQDSESEWETLTESYSERALAMPIIRNHSQAKPRNKGHRHHEHSGIQLGTARLGCR